MAASLKDFVIGKANGAKALCCSARDYEIGRYNNGIPNPIEAIKMYEAAMNTYDELIRFLDTELSEPKTDYIEYTTMIAEIKRIAEKEKSFLPNIITRNNHYIAGLNYEKMISTADSSTSFTDFIDLCKKAESEYKKAENLDHNGARSCYARLLYYIEGKISEAIMFYEQASAEGDAAAMNELGILYAKGKVNGKIERDTAIKYYDHAIALNYINAMLNRAALHEEDKQYDKVIELYQKACALDSKDARDEINKFAQRLCIMVRDICDKKDEVYNAPQLENIKEICKVMRELVCIYQQGRINNGVAEHNKAAALIEQVTRIEAYAINSLKRSRTNERDKENIVGYDTESSPQKKRKTTRSPVMESVSNPLQPSMPAERNAFRPHVFSYAHFFPAPSGGSCPIRIRPSILSTR